MCVSDALVAEIKRIVKESEILKYVHVVQTQNEILTPSREDDTKWPQKNKDGRQELEIRLGSEHISFEVCSVCDSIHKSNVRRLPKSDLCKMSRTRQTQKGSASSTTSFKI